MSKKKLPVFNTIDGEGAFGALDRALWHAKSLKDKELTKLIQAALDRLVTQHSDPDA